MKRLVGQKIGLIFSLLFVITLWTVFQVTKEQYAIEKQFEPQTAEEGSARLVSLGTPTLVAKHPDKESQVILNDPNMTRNWGIGGDSDTNIKASQAWSISMGSKDVVVAIIDTGIDKNHPDLKNNLWINPGESGRDKSGRDKSTNGIDDDQNGFIDDVHGYNFVSNNSDLTDNHGHGTHVAGIVGAEGGNSIGISGVAPKVSLMVLKYYDPKSAGNDNLRNTIKAIQYAVKMKAHIINYSGGGLDFSREEFEAVKMAKEEGILFVAAAGNEKSNSDKQPYFPANYPLDNIISVTAINPQGKVLQSSNFGENSVHLAAPGEAIYSTLPGNKYGLMTGTSQATAFVSGVAALIKASNGEFNYQAIRKQILATGNQSEELFGKAKTASILNSYAALAIQPSIPASGAVISQTASAIAVQPSLPTSTDASSVSRQLSGILEALRLSGKQN